MDGEEISCHLHDPGRLTELIFPGNRVLVRESTGRKTSHSITAALKENDWILTDSRFHNQIARQFLSSKAVAEVRLGKSRIDFLDQGSYVEVKGCSLESNGVARFPDAPSVRASKHLQELVGALAAGMQSEIMILVFSPNSESFEPNGDTDPVFSSNFYTALGKGVEVRVLKFKTNPEGVFYLGTIPLKKKSSIIF